jgi:hypothetical protein
MNMEPTLMDAIAAEFVQPPEQKARRKSAIRGPVGLEVYARDVESKVGVATETFVFRMRSSAESQPKDTREVIAVLRGWRRAFMQPPTEEDGAAMFGLGIIAMLPEIINALEYAQQFEDPEGV